MRTKSTSDLIVKRNGEIISNDLLSDMKKSVGFTITKIKTDDSGELDVKDSWSAYLGDKELLVCIKDANIAIISKKKLVHMFSGINDSKLPFKKFRNIFNINGINFNIKRLDDNQFKLKFKYNNDLYECLYK